MGITNLLKKHLLYKMENYIRNLRVLTRELLKGKNIPIVGIDLGTTYSCVGVFHNDEVKILANIQGNYTTPSMVCYTNGEILVGDKANGQAKQTPKHNVYDAKRIIGKKFLDEDVQADKKRWPFKV